MSIKRLEIDMEKQEVKINGEQIRTPLEVDIFSGNQAPVRRIFNGSEMQTGTFLPLLLIEASALNAANAAT